MQLQYYNLKLSSEEGDVMMIEVDVESGKGSEVVQTIITAVIVVIGRIVRMTGGMIVGTGEEMRRDSGRVSGTESGIPEIKIVGKMTGSLHDQMKQKRTGNKYII